MDTYDPTETIECHEHNRELEEIDDYGKKYLIAHLVDAGDWDKIEELIDDSIWGEEARKALGRPKPAA